MITEFSSWEEYEQALICEGGRRFDPLGTQIEVAKQLGITPQAVWNLLARGRLDAVRIKGDKYHSRDEIIVTVPSVERYIETAKPVGRKPSRWESLRKIRDA